MVGGDISSPEYAARAVSSIPFLKELVHWKDTCNEKYYTSSTKILQSDTTGSSSNTCTRGGDEEHHHHIVEYTGRLWFLRKTPVRFQEIVRLVGVSSCGMNSTVECITKYRATKKSEWVDCARVLCKFSRKRNNEASEKSTNTSEHRGLGGIISYVGGKLLDDAQQDGDDLLGMEIQSELLVGLPLFGIRGKITEQISKTFEEAANNYLANIAQKIRSV